MQIIAFRSRNAVSGGRNPEYFDFRRKGMPCLAARYRLRGLRFRHLFDEYRRKAAANPDGWDCVLS